MRCPFLVLPTLHGSPYVNEVLLHSGGTCKLMTLSFLIPVEQSHHLAIPALPHRGGHINDLLGGG